MAKKLITLKPLTPFFFGGETTFGDEASNYFVKSNYLPQQTAILGMLRYEVLRQNGLLGKPSGTWEDKIGPKSFDGTSTDFGAISNLSPVFLSSKNEHYTIQAMDWAMHEIEQNDGKKVLRLGPVLTRFQDITASEFAISNGEKHNIPILSVGKSPFDPKYGLKPLWVKSDGSDLKQWDFEKTLGQNTFDSEQGFTNGFFIKHEQIGIHRNKNASTDEKDGNFYKQIYYKLLEDYSFSFFVDIDEDKAKVNSSVINMGGERSTFQMEVKDAEDKTFDSVFSKVCFTQGHTRNYPCIILTSNAFCDNKLLSLCKFSICESINFRNIKTVQKDGINYSKFRKDDFHKNIEKYNLLKSGSVLFPLANKMEELEKHIHNTIFKNIGYNYYIKLN